MNPLELHFKKILEMSEFESSPKYTHLSAASKYRFKQKKQYHVNQLCNHFWSCVDAVVDALKAIGELFVSLFNDIAKRFELMNKEHGDE